MKEIKNYQSSYLNMSKRKETYIVTGNCTEYTPGRPECNNCSTIYPREEISRGKPNEPPYKTVLALRDSQ